MKNWERLNDDSALRDRLARRGFVIRTLRQWFLSAGFDEVETPAVVRSPGMEPNLSPFETSVVRGQDGARFSAGLITSPEYQMKKLLAAGYERIFEICRVFRNGEPFGAGDDTHNPEFTMIEWYPAQADYTAIMRDTEEMVAAVARAATGSALIQYAGRTIDLTPPWPRLTVAEAMLTHASLDLSRAIDDPAWFRQEVAARGLEPQATDSWDDLFFRLFLRDVEPKLAQDGRPVILHEYPRSMAALSRISPRDPRYAERFEAYVAGIELCNAYSELTDQPEQSARLATEAEERRAAGKTVHPIDDDFVRAVGQMPPSAGIALGVDRLVMLLTNSRNIRDILFFPAEDLFH